MAGEAKTVVFFPESAYGPTNNCIGIGDVLRRRGHRVVFVLEESFAGLVEPHGFEERLMRLAPAPEEPEAPGQFWKDFIRETAPVFRKPTLDQLGEFIVPTFEALADGARFVDDRLAEIFAEVDPDVIVEDNVVSFPAILAGARPWVRIVSCNALEVRDPALPPTFCGLPAGDDSDWATHEAEYVRQIERIQPAFSEFCVERGAPPLPGREMEHESAWLNLTVVPAEADYERSRPLGPTWHRLESSVRTTDDPWEMPPELIDGEGSLIYLSLGSLGSGDVELMRRLVAILGELPHRFIVSSGPQHAEYELAPNMAGAEFLPQTSVLPHVDLVITHGGNNTVTECFHFGIPMLVLPIFWDQHDNAQRVEETGFGRRLDTYRAQPGEFREAIDSLLGDVELRARMAAIAARLQANPGTQRAAELIERVALTGEPVSGRPVSDEPVGGEPATA
ncbi:glycosyl transferase [Thermoleophilia bacterium SCSIO 60948]|nr:glycosyl transferase [Thermoleophilia bacterium SCSIO 60948]